MIQIEMLGKVYDISIRNKIELINRYSLFYNCKQQRQKMFFFIEYLLIAFLLYSLIKIIRRKLCKPKFEGKRVWITGASSGIGEFLAYQFNSLGAEVIISARNIQQLNRVKGNCTYKEKVSVVQLDMTNFDQIKKVTSKIISELQGSGHKLDIVVENAGVSMRSQFKDYDLKNHISMFALNVHGPFYHLQCILQHFIKNKSGQIVGITSVQGKLSPPFRVSYAGSKHAFIGILDSIRSQVSQYGVKVTNIMPGYVATNLSKNAFAADAGKKCQADDKKGMKPEKFCKETVRAIFMQEKQAQISNQPDVPIGIFLRNLCPDLVFFGLKLKAKSKPQLHKKQK